MFFSSEQNPEIGKYLEGVSTAITAIHGKIDEIVPGLEQPVGVGEFTMGNNHVQLGNVTVGKYTETEESYITFKTMEQPAPLPKPVSKGGVVAHLLHGLKEQSSSLTDDGKTSPSEKTHRYVMGKIDGEDIISSADQAVAFSPGKLTVSRDVGKVRHVHIIKACENDADRPGFELIGRCYNGYTEETVAEQPVSVLNGAVDFSKQLCTIMEKLGMDPETIPQILRDTSWAEKLAKPVTTQRPQGR